MSIKNLVSPAIIVLALAAAPIVAAADDGQHHARGHQGGSRSDGRSSSGGHHAGGNGSSRQSAAQPYGGHYAVPRSEARGGGHSNGSYDHGYSQPSHDSRSYGYHSSYPAYGASHGYRSYGYGAYPYRQAYGYRPYYGHSPWLLPSYHPYYAFRPRFSIGFGVYVGYPVAFSAWSGYGPRYGYPAYGYPAYGAPAPGYGVAVSPGSAGGVSFEIDPPDTQLYVDGQYIGTTGTYSATAQPLVLAPGRHRVQLQAEGFQPVAMDLDIVPGQIIPYRGSLVPY